MFWTDRHFSLGRFPPLDRIDYIDHAVVLTERECVRPVRPTLEQIRHYLGGAPFANWADQAQRFAIAETLEPKDRKSYLRTLLYPGRFCYSWMTGRIGSNDDAVAFAGPIPRLIMKIMTVPTIVGIIFLKRRTNRTCEINLYVTTTQAAELVFTGT